MLVLARRVGEDIIITVPPSGKEQRIQVVFTEWMGRQGKIKLGIEADKSIVIHRGEIQECVDKGFGRRDS